MSVRSPVITPAGSAETRHSLRGSSSTPEEYFFRKDKNCYQNRKQPNNAKTPRKKGPWPSLDRVPASGRLLRGLAGGPGFKSRRARHFDVLFWETIEVGGFGANVVGFVF